MPYDMVAISWRLEQTACLQLQVRKLLLLFPYLKAWGSGFLRNIKKFLVKTLRYILR
jgi:hypothetical protein